MFVAHLQVDAGLSIEALAVKQIIAFMAARQWPEEPASPEMINASCKEATEEGRVAGLFGYSVSVVNWAQVTNLVSGVSGLKIDGVGLLINTRANEPSLLYVSDNMVRVARINFDFPDYAQFEFNEHMTLRKLTDIDKTLLRLANHPTKRTRQDGTVEERIVA